MNHVLYNISTIMILIGIIILTTYLTKAYADKPNCSFNKEQETTMEDVFNNRPSKVFDRMFNKPDIWQGYATVNVGKETFKDVSCKSGSFPQNPYI